MRTRAPPALLNTRAADLIALSFTSAAGHGADDQKRLRPRRDRVRQRRVGRFVRQILLAREEPHERRGAAA